MVIRSGEKRYKLPVEDNDTIEKWELFRFCLSRDSNPNIITNEHGEIIQVMIYISKSTYECLQNQGFANATESSHLGVIVNVDPNLAERLFSDPKGFWEYYIGGGKS